MQDYKVDKKETVKLNYNLPRPSGRGKKRQKQTRALAQKIRAYCKFKFAILSPFTSVESLI